MEKPDNVWDSNVPVETSSYLQDDEISFFNIDNFRFDANKPTMIDLFCGAGGFSVGCSWSGYQAVFGVDHFKPAMETWVHNHPHSIGCLGDIRKVQAENIHKLLKNKGVTKIDLLTGGVPCQGFTIANRKHNDFDERNFLYIEYMKYVREFTPSVIVLENVSGMRSTAGGHFEKEIKKQMEELGYDTKVTMLNAADYGVPQQRQRLIFVGFRKDVSRSEFYFPKPIFSVENYRTVGDAFSDLPPLKASEQSTEYLSAPQNAYQSLLRGEGAIPEIPQPEKLYNHIAPNHPQSTIDLIGATKPGEPMYEKFKQRIRLSNDKPSPTQLAGGIRPSFQFGHPSEPRGLTTRERARIQSFPDSYVFKGGIVQERVQTGNAAPPLLVHHLMMAIKEALIPETT